MNIVYAVHFVLRWSYLDGLIELNFSNLNCQQKHWSLYKSESRMGDSTSILGTELKCLWLYFSIHKIFWMYRNRSI